MPWQTGAAIGLEAAADCGFSGQPVDLPEVDPESTALTPLWRVRGTRGKAFVDFQNDVTDDDVALAGHEGFRAVEHLKRYTTLGMATDQGKTSNVDRPGADGGAHRQDHPADRHDDVPPAVRAGRRSARSPGMHRGKEFRPTRLPPSHRWAQEQGAVFVETGALAARAVVSAARRDRLARERQPRGADGARERRRVRRVDARQDRPAGARTPPSSWTASTPTPGPPSPSAGRATA